MSPKRPSRPHIEAPENTPTGRITTPDIPAFAHRLPDSFVDPTLTHPAWQMSSAPAEDRRRMIEIYDLPAGTHVQDSTTQRPISRYFLPPGLANRLPPPDGPSGIRSAGRHTYADLAEGETVLISQDAQSGWRARLANELIASGPLLERVEGTLVWRPVQTDNVPDTETSPLPVTRRRPADDEPPAVPPKHRRLNDTLDPWHSWGIDPQHAVAGDIRVDGTQYKVIARGDASSPIVYIKNPSHLIYDFDLLDRTLRTELLQQPRGAIQVPPDHHWQIDPTLPFERPMSNYIAQYFPELSTTSLEKVAFHQFVLANGSEIATGAGLTLLRQTFNDWKAGNRHPRPQLADPLLMLPILPSSGSGVVRITELPSAVSSGPLQRLDFEPLLFREQWQYFQYTQSAVELKRFMATLLARNGYTVFEPSLSNSFPALVFKRSGHDFVYFMSLHRIRGQKVNQTLNTDTHGSSLRLHIQVGAQAAQTVLQAHADNRVIWLRGGAQLLSSAADTVFIIRDSHSML